MGSRPCWAFAACCVAMAATILAAALAVVVERTQPTVVDVPDQALLAVEDVPMYNIVVYGPESDLDTYGQ